MTSTEAELIRLQEEFKHTRDPRVQERYRELHAVWMASKAKALA